MGFESKLVAQHEKDFEWLLVEPLKYQGNTEPFVVPVDFKTDFASVPAIFQWLIPRTGRYTSAAVLHDYLWRTPSEASLADADGIFRRAMAELKVPFLRRWLMWAAVRVASLIKSRGRDWRGFPRVLLLVLVPGSLVIVGGLLVFVLLLGFWTVELIVFVILLAVRRIPAARPRVTPTNWPTISWSS